ncbi:MAG: uracil-DNA glycosylase family protein [Pseudomonadota bacterium]|nr:uracil-DNA glycosylase family protein [Pseudomonadota bacterium]MDP1905188.1 uracil-DNA glycosylase family protein [Pseudomonadota bacterium]MDP2352960.1 uracil-DNA glycosylase family protein [Pseudomonadota bacterium]
MLTREDCFKEMGLLPRWRLKNVAPASRRPADDVTTPPDSKHPHLTQGIHTRGYLPHVKAQGATYFVTFRLADSLPAEVLESWADAPESERARNSERYLDRGVGECLLSRNEIADIVVQALRHHEGARYTLHEYVVMPNHVHLLLTPLGEHTLSEILHSLKSWTAQKINGLLGRNGAIWQRESFDRVVRDDDEMRALAAYIRRNPVKARLCAEEDGFRFGSAWKNAGRDACATSPVAQASLPASVQSLDWPALTAAIKTCTLCDLHQTRTQGVPGVGDIHADWLFIGEAPGADEDRQGEPFVGQAGKLLDAMLGALRLKRGENVYIANVLKSRPPGNRDPQPAEVAACLPYLERQIDLIKPKLIVAVGRIAAQNLLRTDTPIGKLRGRVHEYRGLPLVVTYHPAYLLRSPADKAKVWEDLVLAVTTMNHLKAGTKP